jgi:SnoaL-like domain
MHEHPAPVDVAIAYTKAWTSHDMTTAAGYVAEDVRFEGPMTQSAGIDAFMDGLSRFAQAVTGLEILAAVGSEERALIMYDLTTSPFGMLRAAEDLVISEGKIARDTLVFDTHAVRKVQEAPPPAG